VSILFRPDHLSSEKAYNVDEVRLKYARAYESRTEAEENQLISEYKSKMPILEIDRTHQQKRNVIGSRLKKLMERGII